MKRAVPGCEEVETGLMKGDVVNLSAPAVVPRLAELLHGRVHALL